MTIVKMKYMLLLAMPLFLAGCIARSESDAITHGMKWSIAQRDLEQHAWTSTLTKTNVRAMKSGAGGNAYRYLNPRGETVDIFTENVGDIEKVYRIFDAQGVELDMLRYK